MQKYKSEIDVPVFINFFNRPNTLEKVFESVKKARPSKLFLSCDGPRAGRYDDTENIKKCQAIVENIDWECDIHKNYSDENLGCGMRMYTGISWAFEYVDRLIIIEDDCVLSQDFFRFGYELLERYKDDIRICMINAMNHLGIYDNTPYSYFYSGGCCWGWATWKRVWSNMDYNMDFMQNEYELQCIENKYKKYRNLRKIVEEKKKLLDEGKKLSAWTFQCDVSTRLQHQLCITPKCNMVTNIGLTEDSGHALNNINKLSKKIQAYYNAPTYPMEFPLNHPKYLVEDVMYEELVEKKFKQNIFDKMEGILRRIRYIDNYDLKKLRNKLLFK